MQVTSRRRIYWAILVILLGLGWLSYWSTPPSIELTSLATLGILLAVNVGSVVVILRSRTETRPDFPQLSLARKNDDVMAAILGVVGIMALAIEYPYRWLGLSQIYLVIIPGFLASALGVYIARKSNRKVAALRG